MSDKCFICLRKSCSKVCKMCNCYAHYKCLSKYCNYNMIHLTLIEDNSVNYFCINNSLCPLCKSYLEFNKRITRKNTLFSRNKAFSINIKSIIDTILQQDNLDMLKKEFTKMYKFILKNKKMISHNYELKNILKNNLKKCYFDLNFKKANLFYLSLFGKQICKK